MRPVQVEALVEVHPLHLLHFEFLSREAAPHLCPHWTATPSTFWFPFALSLSGFFHLPNFEFPFRIRICPHWTSLTASSHSSTATTKLAKFQIQFYMNIVHVSPSQQAYSPHVNKTLIPKPGMSQLLTKTLQWRRNQNI